jgi:uncharacterized protein YciI
VSPLTNLFIMMPLHFAQKAYRRGEIVLAGALGMPPDGALLIIRASDPSIADAFARDDPCVVNGLVTRWEAQPWVVVVRNAPAGETLSAVPPMTNERAVAICAGHMNGRRSN